MPPFRIIGYKTATEDTLDTLDTVNAYTRLSALVPFSSLVYNAIMLNTWPDYSVVHLIAGKDTVLATVYLYPLKWIGNEE